MSTPSTGRARWLGAFGAGLLVAGAVRLLAANVEHALRTLAEEAALGQARALGIWLRATEPAAELDRRCREAASQLGVEVTLVSEEGDVLATSAAGSSRAGENLRDVVEISRAFLRGSGVERRRGKDGRPWLYAAVRQGDSGTSWVIRVGSPAPGSEPFPPFFWNAVAAVSGLLAGAFVLFLPRRGGTPSSESSPSLAGKTGVERLEDRLSMAEEEKRNLEAILRSMVEGVLVLDRTGVVRIANRRAAQLLGREREEALLGHPLIRLTRDPDLQALVREIERSRRPVVRELTLEAERREHLQVTATPIGDGEAATHGFVLVFHDVTELKRLEAVRKDFVANLSHELQTPLTSIRGYAETLRTLESSGEVAHCAEVIERNALRLSRLLEDLRALSDLELRRTSLRKTTVRVPDVLAAALEVVAEAARRKALDVRTEIPEDLPPLFVDAARVERVFVNLLDNAVKYSEPGGRIRLAASRTESGRIRIEVEDTGIGIPPEELPRVTERFYRVEKGRSRERGGSGLGLAIAKHIVLAHGGELGIRSEVGRGTVVTVELPLGGGDATDPRTSG